MKMYKDLSPSLRTIMTPGPVEVDPRVLRAMSFPILGQFDPEFTDLMNETMGMLRQVFQTSNQWAYPVDGTSRSGIEAALTSLIEPGDKVLIPIYGRFGYLLMEIAERCGAEIATLETEWGSVFDPEEVIRAIHREKPKLVAIVHGETSTGRMQPLADIGKVCRELDILLVVDAVATIGGTPVETDAGGLMWSSEERKNVFPCLRACPRSPITAVRKRKFYEEKQSRKGYAIRCPRPFRQELRFEAIISI